MTTEPDELNETLEERLLDAYSSEDFFGALRAIYISPECERAELSETLVNLHNNGRIDLVSAFALLTKTDSEFFLIRNLFDNALPHLSSDVLPVAACVVHLVREAGQDLAAGSTINKYGDFLAADPSRPEESLPIVEADADLHSLLPPTLIAGATVDIDTYIQEALRLIRSEDSLIRVQAVFALGRFPWSKDKTPTEEVYRALEEIRDAGQDDRLLAETAIAAASFLRFDLAQEDRLLDLVNGAINQGAEHAVSAAARMIASTDTYSCDRLIGTVLPYLKRVQPEHTGTVSQIDYGMYELIKSGHIDPAIDTLGEIIELLGSDLDSEAFQCTFPEIQATSVLLSKVMTRWLFKGTGALCLAAERLAGSGRRENLPVEVDPAELDLSNEASVLYLARKIVGYLFNNPISATSMLLSTMQQAQSSSTRKQVAAILFDPILINYPGEAKRFIDTNRDSCKQEVAEELAAIDSELEKYFKTIRSIEDLPELAPPDTHREAYMRHSIREMSESMKKAEQKSALLPFIKRKTILYGSSSIAYVQDPSGDSHRTEVAMKSHSIEFELPRMLMLDPIGLEYLLITYRLESRLQ
ncbi:MAG: hypothetical protein AAGI72_14130 [Pseudomonadota bacterium]